MLNKVLYKLKKIKTLKIKLLLEIFFTFFKISPFTFGGGFAMIPMFEKEMVEKKKWIESDIIIDIFAVSQSVPGAIAVNSATFIGYRLAGIPGALVAALGIVMPTFVIIILLAVLLVSFQSNIHVQSAFKGIRLTVTALIAIAAYRMGKTAIKDKTSWIICILALVTLFLFKKMNIVFLIIAGAFVGIIVFRAKDCIIRLHKKVSMSKETENCPDESSTLMDKDGQAVKGGKDEYIY